MIFVVELVEIKE